MKKPLNFESGFFVVTIQQYCIYSVDDMMICTLANVLICLFTILTSAYSLMLSSHACHLGSLLISALTFSTSVG